MLAKRLDHLVTGNSRKIVYGLVQYLFSRHFAPDPLPAYLPITQVTSFKLSYTAALAIIVGLRPASRSYVLMSLIPSHLPIKDHTVSDTAG